jgi:hypothetical protein
MSDTGAPMTTPETARTAEQATEYARLIAAQERTQYQRKVYLSRNGHAPSAEAYRECLAEEAAAFVAAVRSCLPEPQASKASDDDAPVHPEVAWQAVQQLADDIDRKIMGDSAPAGEAVSDGMSLVLHLSDYECRTDHEEAAAFRHFRAKAADIVRAMAVKAASAPPPSTGDKPQPIYTRDNPATCPRQQGGRRLRRGAPEGNRIASRNSRSTGSGTRPRRPPLRLPRGLHLPGFGGGEVAIAD